MMKLTVYEKQLIKSVERLFPDSGAALIVESLIRMGVVDSRRCKVMMVREYVEGLVREGCSKVNAMSAASEKFFCSYEYVRRCMYYYKNVNLT